MNGRILPALRLVLTLLVSAIGAVLARHINLPGGAIIGAIVLTGIARLCGAPLSELPPKLRMAARVVMGLTIGATVTPETLRAIGGALLPVLAMVVIMLAIGLATGWCLYRLARMPLPTALCSTAPGALGAMVALTEDLGGEGPVVASLHLVRILSITLLVPALARALFAHTGAGLLAVPVDLTIDATWKLVGLLAAGLLAGWAAARIKVPAGDLLAGMAIAAIANPLFLHLPQLPSSWRLLAQWIVGAGVGATVSRATLRHFRPYAAAGGLATAVLITSGLGVGWLLSRAGSLDVVTCLVGSAPGGTDTMVVLGAELGADVQLVIAMHVARQVLLTVLLPIIARRVTRNESARRPLPIRAHG